MEHAEPEQETVDTRTEQLAALAHRLIQRKETENAALARKLHDELGACFTVASMEISVVAEKLKHSEPELAARLQRTLIRIKEAVGLKRDIVDALRPPMLDHLGLGACLDELALEFARRTGVVATADIAPNADAIGTDGAISLFRIAQESLHNIERHARARRVAISLVREEDGVRMSVEDDGVGITSRAMADAQSLGLCGMRERMALHGGKLTVRARQHGSGTVIEAWYPRRAD